MGGTIRQNLHTDCDVTGACGVCYPPAVLASRLAGMALPGIGAVGYRLPLCIGDFHPGQHRRSPGLCREIRNSGKRRHVYRASRQNQSHRF